MDRARLEQIVTAQSRLRPFEEAVERLRISRPNLA